MNLFRFNIGALIIRIGFWGIFFYIHKEEPQNRIGNCLGSYKKGSGFRVLGLRFGIWDLEFAAEDLGFNMAGP